MNNTYSAATWPVDAQPLTAFEKGQVQSLQAVTTNPVKHFPLLASIQK